jgi:hypothetical protein
VVGSSPIEIGSPGGTLAKEKAIDSGLWEGVIRVARDLLREQEAAESSAEFVGGSDSSAGLEAPGPGLGPGARAPESSAGGFALPGQKEFSGENSPRVTRAELGGRGDGASGREPYADPYADPYSPPDSALGGAGYPPGDPALAEVRAEEFRRIGKIAEREETERIRQALGRDTVSYTKSFRIVEDQGERPALFTDDPDVATEYLVLLEVQVEVDRVRGGLEQAGLLRPLEVSELTGIEIEILGLGHYAGYQALLTLLRSDGVGAAEVSPRHFGPDRVILVVEGEWEAPELVERLQARAPENLVIEALDRVPRRPPGRGSLWGEGEDAVGEPEKLVLRVAWAPLPPPEAESAD